MKKKLISTVLTLCMLFTLAFALGVPAAADSPAAKVVETGVTYATVQEAINAAVEGVTAAADAKTVQLLRNVDLYSSIVINEEKFVILDLNGKVLNGATNTYRDKKCIFNEGTLTIKDSDSNASHKFSPNADGLWVWDEEHGTKTLLGGCITGGKAENGGGINSTGILTVTGGNIVGNSAEISDSTKGGGIAIESGTAYIQGGKIVGNTADMGGGVCNFCGTLIVTGGEISENTAKLVGGGVADIFGDTTLGGTARITGNTLTDGTTASNLTNYSAKESVSTTSPLSGNAEIGVTLLDDKASPKYGPFTINGAAGDVKYFFSDNPAYGVLLDESGETPVLALGAVTSGSLECTIQSDMWDSLKTKKVAITLTNDKTFTDTQTLNDRFSGLNPGQMVGNFKFYVNVTDLPTGVTYKSAALVD